VKIVARMQNPLSSQDDPTQMLRGEISHSNLHLVDWHSHGWRFERRFCKLICMALVPSLFLAAVTTMRKD